MVHHSKFGLERYDLNKEECSPKSPKKTMLYTYCPDEPVKPISQTVEKNYEFLTKTSLENNESNKTNSEQF